MQVYYIRSSMIIYKFLLNHGQCKSAEENKDLNVDVYVLCSGWYQLVIKFRFVANALLKLGLILIDSKIVCVSSTRLTL